MATVVNVNETLCTTSDPKLYVLPTGCPAGVEDVERVVGLDVDAVVPLPGAEELLEVEVALRRTQARHAVRAALENGWDGSICS